MNTAEDSKPSENVAADHVKVRSSPTSISPGSGDATWGNEEKRSDSTGTEPNSQSVDATPKDHTSSKRSLWCILYDIITWTPSNCRWDPAQPARFSMSLNVLFAFAGAFTVANLYYNHPILNILADEFHVSYTKVSQIPTLAQAGYAVGLLLLCPLGDLLKRRPFVLSLVFFTATVSIGLAATSSFAVFSAIQFISAVTTVTPQLLMPLVGDLAPPKKRAAALSIVTSGFMLGILLARLLSGIVTQFTSWRTIYWLSVGLQYLIFILLWLFMPDYPSTNPGGLNYFKMLWSIVIMLTKHPVLVQACLISYFVSSTFTNYWTVLTFLLSGPPYYYTPVIIGLFALIGIASMCFGPLYAKHVTDRFVPLFTVLLGMLWCMLGICLGTYTGTFTVAGPILQALFLDFGMQTSQIANRSAIYAIEPRGRNRVNTAFMLFTFLGQLTGTSVGARLYSRAGWVASGSYSVAAIGAATLITLARGPWEEGWVGWHGGAAVRKKNRDSADGKETEARNQLQRITTPERIVVLEEQSAANVENGMNTRNHQHDHRGHPDFHEHHHGRDNQNAVNSMDPEKNLELTAAHDLNDEVREKDEFEEPPGLQRTLHSGERERERNNTAFWQDPRDHDIHEETIQG